jgi:predicted ABC-type ATPase
VRKRGGADVVGGGGHEVPDDARPAPYARRVGIVEDVLAQIDAAFVHALVELGDDGAIVGVSRGDAPTN